MDLRGRVALVTGAGRRVGRALAVALGAEGMNVAVHYHASDAGARETARMIERAGGKGWLVAADLTGDTAAGLIDDVVRQLGGLDVLVNS
ncbi:MAG: SDR family NAD(P)-dependent oxidoreductase, partial [Myxococcales bacterium]